MKELIRLESEATISAKIDLAKFINDSKELLNDDSPISNVH